MRNLPNLSAILKVKPINLVTRTVAEALKTLLAPTAAMVCPNVLYGFCLGAALIAIAIFVESSLVEPKR